VKGWDGSTRKIALLIVAALLMVGGAAMLIAGLDAGVAFPVIAVGIALTVIVQGVARRRPNASR
jgi:hypothetical protein